MARTYYKLKAKRKYYGEDFEEKWATVNSFMKKFYGRQKGLSMSYLTYEYMTNSGSLPVSFQGNYKDIVFKGTSRERLASITRERFDIFMNGHVNSEGVRTNAYGYESFIYNGKKYKALRIINDWLEAGEDADGNPFTYSDYKKVIEDFQMSNKAYILSEGSK